MTNSKFIKQKFLTKFKYVNLVLQFNLLKLQVFVQSFTRWQVGNIPYVICLDNLVVAVMNLSFIKNCVN